MQQFLNNGVIMLDEPKRMNENETNETDANAEPINANTNVIDWPTNDDFEATNAEADIDPLTFTKNETNANEEFAAEVAAAPPLVDRRVNEDRLIQPEDDVPNEQPVKKDTFEKGRGLGITALILSIVSLFIFNVFLGPIAAIMGIFAYRQGQRSLGIWSIILGTIALFIGISLLTLFR
jgi:hypothetical protein